MTEKEKMLKGMLYDANYDPQLIEERLECKELCRDYNELRPKDIAGRNALLRKILGAAGDGLLVEQPFYCDYGYNIRVGKIFLPISIWLYLTRRRSRSATMCSSRLIADFIRPGIRLMPRSVISGLNTHGL